MHNTATNIQFLLMDGTLGRKTDYPSQSLFESNTSVTCNVCTLLKSFTRNKYPIEALVFLFWNYAL